MTINIDIYFPELACDFVTIDVMDSTGLVVLWILKIRYHYRYIFISLYSFFSHSKNSKKIIIIIIIIIIRSNTNRPRRHNKKTKIFKRRRHSP